MTHDPERDWWGSSVDALRAMAPALEGLAVAGVGLAGLFPAVALVGADGIATTEGILHGDSRATGEADGGAGRGHDRGPTLRGRGQPASRLASGPQSAAIRGAAVALGPAGYVGRRLTGINSIDPHSAVRWGFRLADGDDWRREDLEALGSRRACYRRSGVPAR